MKKIWMFVLIALLFLELIPVATSENEYVYITFEDGNIEGFSIDPSRSDNLSLDSNASINGKYCLNFSKPDNLAGAAYMDYSFPFNYTLDLWTSKIMFKHYESHYNSYFSVNLKGFGDRIIAYIKFKNNNILSFNNVDATDFFWYENETYTVKFFNIDYTNHKISAEVYNDTDSYVWSEQTWGSSTNSINGVSWSDSGSGIYTVFIDDVMIGIQGSVYAYSPSNITTNSAKVKGHINHTGSPNTTDDRIEYDRQGFIGRPYGNGQYKINGTNCYGQGFTPTIEYNISSCAVCLEKHGDIDNATFSIYKTESAYSSEYIFNSGTTTDNSVSKLNNSYFVVAYSDEGLFGYGMVIIGKITNNTITYGSEYIFNSANTGEISVSALNETSFVVAYADGGNSNYGTARIGQVSGTSVSFGSEYVFVSQIPYYCSTSKLNDTHFVISYSNNTNGTSIIGVVSGTSISFGSEYVFNHMGTYYISTTSLNETKFVNVYKNDTATIDTGIAVVGNVSGNTISFGSEYVFENDGISTTDISKINSTKVVIVYTNETLKSLSLIANIDGTTISFGNKYVFTSNTASDKSVTVLDSSHIVIFYKDSNNSNYGVSLVGKINNDVITFPYKYRYFNQDSVSGVSSINMDNTSFVVIFTDNENSNYGTSLVGTPFRQPFDSPLISATYNGSYFSSKKWYIINFTSHSELEPSTTSDKYMLVINVSGGNETNYLGWEHTYVQPKYTKGHAMELINNGSTWYEIPKHSGYAYDGRDFFFVLIGNTSHNYSFVYDTQSHSKEYIYYFNDYDPTEAWSSTPEDMVDGDNETFAGVYGCDPPYQFLTNHSGNNSLAPTNEKITHVYLRARTWLDKTADEKNAKIYLIPVINGINGSLYDTHAHHTEPTGSGYWNWSDWLEITAENKTWDWNTLKTLQCRVYAYFPSVGSAWVTQVEIKVTLSLNYTNQSNIERKHYISGTNFSKNLTGLSPGTMYFYRFLQTTQWSFENKTEYSDEYYFLTKPTNATNCAISLIPYGLNISWTAGAGAIKQILKYSTSPMTSFNDGTEIYNGTKTHYEHTPLQLNIHYYYAVWEYVENNTYSLNQHSLGAAENDYFYAVDPPYNGSSKYYTGVNALNLTWDRGNFSDREIVVMKNGSYPTSPTDGIVKQNSTNTYYNESNKFTEGYYTIFSYNKTSKVYSINGLNIPWGALGISVFNESNPSQAVVNWNLQISNENGSNTYTAFDCTNPKTLDFNDIPYGKKTIIRIWEPDNYKERIWYRNLYSNNFYNFTFFLPANSIPPGGEPGGGPSGNESFSPELYYIRVIDELSYPIKDAKVLFQRYINTTDSFENMSTLYTDANGYVNLYLIPEVLYKVIISKTGYITEISDYIPPSPDDFGQVPEKVFQLRAENETAPPPNIEPEEVSFTGYIQNTTLYLTYLDNMNQTINTSVFVYEINTSTGNITLFGTNATENISSFSVTFENINISNIYKVVLFYNHTTFGSQKKTLIFQGTYTPATTPDVINNLLTIIIGANPFGWSNLLIWFFLVAAMYYADQRDAGKILILLGGIFLFINIAIGFNTTLLSVAGGIIPTLFIVVGIITIWNDSRKKGFT